MIQRYRSSLCQYGIQFNLMGWKENKMKVCIVGGNEVWSLKVLRSSQIDKYNNRMGDVDIADRLRGV